jgi:hypothetical protein
MRTGRAEMAVKRASEKTKSGKVFGRSRKQPKMFRVGLYARVSTQDQKTLPLQIRAMREYAATRGWTIGPQVKEVGSGVSERELRQQLMDAARRREIDIVLVWRLDRWGRVTARSGLHAGGTESSRRRVRVLDRGSGSDYINRPGIGRSAFCVCSLRTRDSARTCPRWSGACASERQTTRSACNSCSQICRNRTAPSRRYQQSRDRPAAGHRPHFGTPHSRRCRSQFSSIK